MNSIYMRMIRLLFGVLALNSIVGMAQVAQFNDATSVMQQPVSPVIGYEPGRNLAVQQQPNQVSTVVDAKQLRQWAETLGLGYKTANLMQLSKLLKQFNGKLPGGYDVKVPQFYGIAAKQTNNVLSKQGLVLGRSWKEIVERTVTKEAYDNHEVTPEFVKACEGLADAIEAKFNKAADVIAAQEKAQQNQSLWRWLEQSVWESESPLIAAGFDAATAKEIMALVKAVAKDKGFVTLRSTGLREDTTTIANAGGNESREIVRANLAETMRAMGAVASSYLRSKSLSQRSGKDEKIFELPELPVLLQRVVGEHEGGPVVSCVAYSQEREGNTEGVTVAQCAYGHGKTVVDSLFPVDTYYVDDKTGVQRTVIRLKTKRMAPRLGSTSFGLEEVAVEESQQKESALDSTAQRAIHAIMINLEHAYGQPMDVELVTDPAKKIVYLVQARPIVYEAQKVQPMYVADSVVFDKANAVSCKKIYETGAVYSLKPAAVWVTDNLESALKTVLDAEGKKQPDPQVIVVKEPGAITSHAGATLAGKGIALLQVDDTKQLNGILANKDAQLVVDTQRGLIADVTQDKRFAAQNEAALTKSGVLVAGRYSHPIAPVMSVVTKEPRKDIDTKLSQYAQLKDSMPNQSVQGLLTMLKEAPQAQAHAALEILLGRVAKEIDGLAQQQACKDVAAACSESADQDVCKIQTLLKGTCFKEKTAAEATTKMRSVFNAMLEVAGQVDQKLAAPSRSMDRLLMVNFLETLMLQETSTTVVNAYSVENIKAAFAKEVDFINKKLAPMMSKKVINATLLANRPLLLTAQKGADAAPTMKSEETWITFVSDLGNALKPAALQEFEATVKTIDALGALPTWIYARVAPAMAKEPDAVKLSSALLKEFDASKAKIAQLQTIKQKLTAVDYSRWQDTKNFEKNVKNLKAQLLDSVESNEFLDVFAKDNDQPLVRMVAVPVMRELVSSLDTIIKTVKASTLYPNDEAKVKDFKILVDLYLGVLNKWASALPAGVIVYNPGWPLDRYVKKLTSIIGNGQSTAGQLLPSDGFEVRAAALGSAANVERHLPKTLEDTFTTIHQSLETVLGAFVQDLVSSIELPSIARSADTILRAQRAQVTGVTIAQGRVTMFYNLPLLNHSAAFALSWSKQSPGVELTYKWYGEARARWSKILAMGDLIGGVYGVAVKDRQLGEQSTSFTHVLQNERALYEISQMLPLMVSVTDVSSAVNANYLRGLAAQVPRTNPRDVFTMMLALDVLHVGNIADFGNDVAETFGLLQAAVKNTDPIIRDKAFGLLCEYVKKEKRYVAKVIDIAGGLLGDRDENMRGRALDVLYQYAQQKDYEAKVWDIANEHIKDANGLVRLKALGLIGAYANKQGYEAKVWDVAIKCTKGPDARVRSGALYMVGTYADKQDYENKVWDIVRECTKDVSWEVRFGAVELVSAYVNKPVYEVKVWDAATELMKDVDANVRGEVLRVIGAYANIPGYEAKVWDIATEGMKDVDVRVHGEALKVIGAYANKQGDEGKVWDIVNGQLTSVDESIRCKVIDLLGMYANKQDYEVKVWDIANERVYDRFGVVREKAYNLIGMYANKQGYASKVWKIFNRINASHLQRDFIDNQDRDVVVWRLARQAVDSSDNAFRGQVFALVDECLDKQAFTGVAVTDKVFSILWQRLSWYQKSYWDTKFLLGATHEQFIEAQLP